MDLYFSEVGKGSPVLLAHGWGSSSATFAQLQPALGEVSRCLAVDLRGFGKTGVVDGRHGVREMATDLAYLAMRVGPVVAVGHSMGGSVVSHLAVEYPDLVSGVVVMDPAYGADKEECAGIEARRAALVAEGAQAAVRDLSQAFSVSLPRGCREEVLRAVEDSDPRVLLESFDGMYVDPDALGPLPQTRRLLGGRNVPVLALYSTARAAAREKQISPGSSVRIAPGPGHFIHLEHPDWTKSVILEWLRESGLL